MLMILLLGSILNLRSKNFNGSFLVVAWSLNVYSAFDALVKIYLRSYFIHAGQQ